MFLPALIALPAASSATSDRVTQPAYLNDVFVKVGRIASEEVILHPTLS